MDSSKILDYYRYAFNHLKRDKSKGAAPHKPVLLLSVLHEFAAGRVIGNQVFITPELTRTFATYWNVLVTSGHEKRFALPFYHLANEKGNWWRLRPVPGCEVWLQNAGSMRTFANLSAAVACAEIDAGLAALLMQPESRQALRQELLATYFPGQVAPRIDDDSAGYVQGLENEVVNESQAEYKAVIEGLQAAAKTARTKQDPEKYEIEVYNRGTVFRREVIRLYQETCCISGLRVSATSNVTLVDACHIKPFALGFDNTLTNGIALCPNLHRAFDRGLLTVDDNYRVVLSGAFIENAASPFNLRQLAGVALTLPSHHLPSLEAFAWHRAQVFQR
ncbi:MAG TPA: HNH endonuclease [Hymenobacter sp.]|uniref:HNH endonuclease n=1 Tax=Hymenobacter sp. TaxID=1898978 RepID=UPI002D7E9050|nr:HNH endonuclease [Hymenobacter sp.]HET9504813.1 HNH endonuclease [Hymenobacter sp.]